MHEYWIGKGVNYRKIWRDFDDGHGYIQKFDTMRVHLLRITLSEPASSLPLFNHEAVYKTIKGCFHDLKQACLTPAEYDLAGPLFLYSIDRGSGIWEFLGELRQLLLFGTTLSDQKVIGESLSNLNARIDFLKKVFGEAVIPKAEFDAFVFAKTPADQQQAMRRLFEQGIKSVEVSAAPFTGNIEEARSSLINLKDDAK